MYSEGDVIFINRAGLELLRAESMEGIGDRPVLEFVHPDDRDLFLNRVSILLDERKSVPPVELRLIRLDGTIVYVEGAGVPIMYGGKSAWQAIVRDISERKMEERRKEEVEAHKREFYRRTILAATEGKLVISEPEEIKHIAGPIVASWEVTQAQDVGVVRRAVTARAGAASNGQRSGSGL